MTVVIVQRSEHASMADSSPTAAITLVSLLSACLVATVAACSSPNRPSVSVASAQPVSPSNATQVSYYSQPVTLVVANGVATGGASPTATLEVATDAAFTAVVITKVIPPGVNGQSTVTLDHLNAATTYYWRVKTAAGNNPGTMTSPESFSIGPQLVIQAPTPVQPLADTFPHKRPTLIVTDAAHSGPDATLTYRFDVATDATFGTLVATGTVLEGAGQTTFTPTVDLIPGTSYLWRAQASDLGKAVNGGYSTPQAFTTVFPEDGAFRYTLAIHAPSYCLTHSVHEDFCGGTKDWDLSDYSFDGTLTVTTDNLQFRLPATPTLTPALLGFARLRNRLSGAISGGSSYLLPNPGPFENAVTFNAAVSGDADNSGHFGGTFDGRVGLIREGFPWTLTPH
jgi:hypothetical protein